MNDDGVLLRQFVDDRSESAFAEIVRRHLDLVYSVALRSAGRDRQLAAEAAQAVFCELARNAAKLSRRASLSGWLYNTARFVASRLHRSENRRAARDLRYSMTQPHSSAQPAGWSEIEALLDDAMQALSDADREAVILRYFRDETFGSIGTALGISENAARMRVDRALDRLRAILSRQGIACPSSLLGSLIAANAISSAPAGLAAGLLAPALAAASGGASGAVTILSLMNTSKALAGSAAVLIGAVSTGWFISHRQAARLRTELAEQRDISAAASPQTDARPSADAAEIARLRAEHAELMRLRAEVTELRREQRARQAATPPPDSVRAKPEPQNPAPIPEERLQALGLAKLSLANAWGVAFFKFAQENDGRMPADFDAAASYLPKIPDSTLQFEEVANNNFEIVYRGSLQDIANPSQAVILRERDSFNKQPDGSTQRTYLFADGHTEIYRSPTGVFEPWEKQRQPILKNAPVQE